jgi:hypothetical protein
VNPVDRDRGLRLVAVVTSVVATLSLVGIGAATGLAAGETREQDALKAAGRNTAPESTAAPTAKPRATVKETKHPKISTSRKTRTARARTTREDSSSRPSTTKPKPRPRPASTRTTAPAVVAPPAVPSTAS